MNHIGEVIPSAIPNMAKSEKDTEICMVCGYKVEFVNDQTMKRCPNCNTMIHATTRRRTINKPTKCYVCFDTGWAFYPVQTDSRIYNMVSRCTCPLGAKQPANIPMLNECQMAPREEYIEHRNKKIMGRA
jgi:predicted RNA-binding Zn-ribbon protein involved in translation (DUF1610 family)